MDSTDNMRWMAEHIHFFEFHTLQASEFKVQLMSWWRSAEPDTAKAGELQSNFLLLCQATPLEVACGWFQDSNSAPDAGSNFLEFTMAHPPRADITVTSLNACFISDYGCFYALLPAEHQALYGNPVRKHRDAMYALINRGKNSVQYVMQEQKKTTYQGLYRKKNNFGILKALLHLILLFFAVMLFPVWWECVSEIVSIISRYGRNSMNVLWRLSIRANTFASRTYLTFPSILAITLICPAVYLDIRQTFCEIWFAWYRVTAKVIMKYRYLRAKQILNRLSGKLNRNTQHLYRMNKPWRRRGRKTYLKIAFYMPKWVRIGNNPLFQKKAKLHLKDIIGIYPQNPPRKRGWVSRPLFPILVRTAFLFFLIVITFNL